MKKSALFATFLFAASALCAADMVTLTGKTYTGVTIKRVDPDGLAIVHDAGAAKVPFTQLSEELRKKFGYDPAKAEAAIKQQAEAEAKHKVEVAAVDKEREAAETKRIASAVEAEKQMAEAKKAAASQESVKGGAVVQFVTAEMIKAEWLESLVEPDGLNRDAGKIRAFNSRSRQAINAGQYDGYAQDEANRVNIGILLANGRIEEADELKQERVQYANRVASAQAQADRAAEFQAQKEQLDTMRNRAMIQSQEMQREIQRLKRSVDDLTRMR